MTMIGIENQFYITSHCALNDSTVYKNGTAVFSSDEKINGFLVSAYHHFQLNYPKFYKMDNLSKLGWLTAEVLLADAQLNYSYKKEEIAIILANANSSLDDDLKYFDTINDIASPSLFVYTLPNIVMGEISIRHKFKGEQAFFIQETLDARFITQQVNYLLQNNRAQCCICGWVDVLGDDYKSALFLVEKQKKENAVLFSAQELERIFNSAAKW